MFAVIKNNVTYRQLAGFAMPISWTESGRDLAVRALPVMGGVSAVVAGPRLRDDVCVPTDNRTAIVTGAFPGPSAWSPPI